MQTRTSGRSSLRLVAVLAAVAITAAACGSSGGGGSSSQSSGGSSSTEGTPVRGGTVTYGLEAETGGGWCLPEAQLAISGIQVADTIYDTLTRPDKDGKIQPFLAKSVEHNADFTKWTITLRSGVKFHDGTDLTAQVVKNNLDAYRGSYPARKPALFIFVFQNVADVQATGPLTVEVTTKTPWPALPWYLWSSGRIGIMAQAQLDDADHCDTNLIGTGPFQLAEWKVNDHLTVKKFPNYWWNAPDGKPYPYLDQIVYRPMPDENQRVNSLQAGEIDAMHTSTPGTSVSDVRDLAKQGDINEIDTVKYTEVNYGMFNESKPPFDSKTARLAVAYSTDRNRLNDVLSKGTGQIASGPFAPGVDGYLKDTGFPSYDLAKAKQMVAKYKQETGNDLSFEYLTTSTPTSTQTAQLIKQMAEAAGMKMSIRQVDQTQLINEALGGNFQLVGWRNHPGADPDTQYVWWHSGSPVNFGRINDPQVDSLLDQGRTTTDPAKRIQIYEQLNKRFASEVHNNWTTWTVWAVGTAKNVHGVLMGDLPTGQGPFPGLVVGHLTQGMWKSS